MENHIKFTQKTLQSKKDSLFSIKALTPTQYSEVRTGVIEYGFHQTLFGEVIIAVVANQICYLNFVLTNSEIAVKQLSNFWNKSEIILNQNTINEFIGKIFGDEDGQIDILLKGTDFQIKVWKALLKIPYGETTNYKSIADQVGHQKALRAVGTAIGRNPVAYLIPCHRVINTSGKLGNYGGGKEKKVQILKFEGAKISD